MSYTRVSGIEAIPAAVRVGGYLRATQRADAGGPDRPLAGAACCLLPSDPVCRLVGYGGNVD